jgi:uncharacterized membrane protein
MNRRTMSWLSAIALLLLQPLWHMLIFPGDVLPTALTTVVLGLPAVIILALTIHGSRTGLLTASLLALLYFCHAIAEWMSTPQTWPMASLELLLSLVVFTTLWLRLRHGDPVAASASTDAA